MKLYVIDDTSGGSMFRLFTDADLGTRFKKASGGLKEFALFAIRDSEVLVARLEWYAERRTRLRLTSHRLSASRMRYGRWNMLSRGSGRKSRFRFRENLRLQSDESEQPAA
jgi:hypothetical protein